MRRGPSALGPNECRYNKNLVEEQKQSEMRSRFRVVETLFLSCVLVLALVSLDEEFMSLRLLGQHYVSKEALQRAKNGMKPLGDSAVDSMSGQNKRGNETDIFLKQPSPAQTAVSLKGTVEGINQTLNDAFDTMNNKESPSPFEPKNATLVVKLGGEMGNNLIIFATARVAQIIASETYNVSAEWVIQHQNSSKWVRAAKNMQQCFPHFRSLDFAAANTPDFEETLEQAQTRWLGNDHASRLLVHHQGGFPDMKMVRASLTYWRSLIDGKEPPNVNLGNPLPVKMPYLTVSAYSPTSFIDWYLDDLRELFAFDYKACCKLRPDPDESVLHLRNFLTEMPNLGKRLGFEQLSPNKTAQELFGHLKEGGKVAITTRFGTDFVQDYVGALRARGLQVRVISGQTDVQDFCFLMEAQKELVGLFQSTFVRWAAYLGRNITKARLYFINSPARRARLGEDSWYEDFNWTHPILKERMSLERYKSEEQDRDGGRHLK